MNEIVSTMDSQLPILEADEKLIYKRVDHALTQVYRYADTSEAFALAKTLIGAQKISGLALAKIFHGIKSVCKDLYPDEDAMYQDIYFQLGSVKSTVDSYALVWKLVDGEYVPKDYLPEIKSNTMRALTVIATLVDEKHDYYKKMDTEDWARIAHAPDGHTVNQLVREIKGKQPHEDAITLRLLKDGKIQLLMTNKITTIGWLEVGSTDVDVNRAVDRIVRGAGIIEEG